MEVFVAILGASQLTYVEAVESQTGRRFYWVPAKTHYITLVVLLMHCS